MSDFTPRKKRRMAIISVYILIALTLITLIIVWTRPEETCFDGKQNQAESGVDCGGGCIPCEELPPIKSLSLEEVDFVKAGGTSYDIYARIKNPNNLYGSANVPYTITLLSADNEVLIEQVGEMPILPGEEKSVLFIGIESEEIPQTITFTWEEPLWETFREYEAPNLPITHKKYNQITGGVGFAEARGTLTNKTPFDLDEIMVYIILRDEHGKILATNTTFAKTVQAGERRDFLVTFPEYFPGEVAEVQMEAATNMYLNDNFVRLYLSSVSL